MAPTLPASPAPLVPSGLVLVGTGLALDIDVAQVMRARHGVIHERGRDQLARCSSKLDVFHQDLADALRDAAMDLAVQQQRIEHGADIVDHAIAHDLDFAGFLVDLDFADVAAVRKILRSAPCRWRSRQAGLHARREPSPGLVASTATSLMVIVRLVLGRRRTRRRRNSTVRRVDLQAHAPAMALPFSMILSVAIRNAALDMVEVREPPVPSP